MKMRLLLALALGAAAAAPATAQPRRNAEFHAFMRERFGEDLAAYRDARYVLAWADLDGDRRPEALVYVISRNFCGAAGCRLYVYRPEQGGWYQETSVFDVRPPFTILNARTRGWHDLALGQGGALPQTVILRHAEFGYDAPAPGRAGPGRTVITGNERGRPLF